MRECPACQGKGFEFWASGSTVASVPLNRHQQVCRTCGGRGWKLVAVAEPPRRCEPVFASPATPYPTSECAVKAPPESYPQTSWVRRPDDLANIIVYGGASLYLLCGFAWLCIRVAWARLCYWAGHPESFFQNHWIAAIITMMAPALVAVCWKAASAARRSDHKMRDGEPWSLEAPDLSFAPSLPRRPDKWGRWSRRRSEPIL